MEILKNPNFDFMGKAKYFAGASAVFLILGIGLMVVRDPKYGVEFSGGTEIVVQMTKTPEADRVRDAVPGATIQTYGDAAQRKVLIRLAAPEESKDPDAIGNASRLALDALASKYPENPVVASSSESVGAIVGKEMRTKAIQLTVLGLAFQLIYIAIRFGGGVWGAGAVVAGIHDTIICLTLLHLFGYEITLNVIAAILTLVGYSVNDTIVVFDRVRENLKQKRKDPLAKILNDSLNQTLTRTIISNGTTFLAVLGLFFFGGEVLAGFSFTMVVGIIVGTYSTLYIAIPIVAWWSGYTEQRQKAALARA
jgi:preprotein translocase subunit SecF